MRLACAGLLSWFERSATIVAPSRLLAAVTTEQFAQYQVQQGRDSWNRTPIYSIEAWLSACWHSVRYSGANVRTLLSPPQENALWETIIGQECPHLFDVGATARLASRAAKLLVEWHIPSDGELWNDHEDAQHFQRWHKLFRRRCQEEGWITRFDIWRLLPRWIAANMGRRELTVFAGFQNVSPALKGVWQVLGESAAVENVPRFERRERVPGKACGDFAHEIEHAARWSRALFEQHPKQSIGIFVPDLSTNRTLVERTFRQVFYPSAALQIGKTTEDSVFHISAAAPLSSDPVVASAMLLLELARPRIPIADAGAILRCPFIAGAATERSQRALADLELRRRRELDVSLAELEAAGKNCPRLLQCLPAVRRVLRKQQHQFDFPGWSEFFADLLKAVGWPGEISAEEQDRTEAWNETLSTLATLGLVSGQLSYDDALAALRHLLSGPSIERGNWSSPIQVLEASEMNGVEFNYAGVIGMGEETWRPGVNANPLVPLKLQRTYHVPGSSPQSAQLERERMTESLFAAARVVVATYSGRVSRLAERFVAPGRADLPQWQGKLPVESYAPIALHETEDTTAPPYRQAENTRGGASLIKSQSLCPFRAFAEFRLNARAPEDGCFGFDSRERGGFVHKALQTVWDQIRTYDRLLSTPAGELEAIVREGVEKAVKQSDLGPLHELMSRTERERLEELIHQWLNFERGRKQSFTVETVEQERYYELPGLRLRLRVDRMDRLKNGKLVLIDYKSGAQTRGKLKCPRPPEPQLLVYAAAVGNEVDGIFFGELKPREPRAVGFARERHFPGGSAEISKNWSFHLAECKSEVQRLASEFVSGYAAVDPIKGACEYCSMKPICRINERAALEQEEE